ncbi:MAG TPA: hypothetical protein VFL83_16750 [Anaeromyxobacter sp.]|nr:hypothetical protein [Anaeromyxobacter sp.]
MNARKTALALLAAAACSGGGDGGPTDGGGAHEDGAVGPSTQWPPEQ